MMCKATHQLPRKRAGEQIQKLVESCGHTFPNLMFVQAGSALTDSKTWTDLRNSLNECLKRTFKNFVRSSGHEKIKLPTMRATSMPLLGLRYVPGSNLSSKCTEELRKWLVENPGTNQNPGINKKTIVVVLLERDEDHGLMYRTIKKACRYHPWRTNVLRQACSLRCQEYQSTEDQ